MNENEQFYVAQKAFIQNGDELLVLNDPIEGLDFPGGTVQFADENHTDSLKREVREEVGLEIEVGEPFYISIYKYPEIHKYSGRRSFIVCYKCKYVSGEIKLSDEHDNFKWVTKDNYKNIDDGTSFFDMLVKYYS